MKNIEMNRSLDEEHLNSNLIAKVHVETPKILTREEKKGIFLLHCLYFVQGIPLGFFGVAISILLVEAGATYSELGILSFCNYPFCMKILFAPIEDFYFSSKFGKRKTYIIPCQYFLSCIFLALSFKIEDLIADKNITTLGFLGFFIVMMVAIQDIAVDGWNLTLLKNENLAWGSVAQTIGQTFGSLFGGNLLILLSSKKFCNEYLFSNPSESPLIPLDILFKLFFFVIFLITLVVHLGVKEKNPEVSHNFNNIWELVREFKGFYFNKNLKYLVIFLLTWKIGFGPIVTTSSLQLIQQGFAKETISAILMLLIPVNFFICFLIGKYVKIGEEMTYYFRFYCFWFFNNIFIYLLVIGYQNIPYNLFISLFFIASFIGEGIFTAIFVNQGGFTNRISDEDVGGSYLTFLNSMSNFGRLGTASLSFFLVGAFNYNLVVLFGWIYIAIYYFLMKQRILQLESIPKHQWKL